MEIKLENISETFVKELCKEPNIKDAFVREGIVKEETKQETLEEFIKKAYLSRLEYCLSVDFEDGVKLGAKWQQQQNKNLYSEEEVYNIIDNAFHLYASSYRQEAKQWFNKHKKQIRL
jgi:hypothetical protein